MDVFTVGKKSVVIWGPTASVEVKAHALSEVAGKDGAWVLEGMTIGAREIVDVRQCFNDVSYIYALGNDQARCEMALHFAVFIGSKSCQEGNNTSTLDAGLKAYARGRISQATDPRPVGIGGFARNGWLVGLDIGSVDPRTGVCHAVAHFIIELGGD